MDDWRQLVETLPQLIWTVTPDGADYFSPQGPAFTGLPLEALLGWGWLDTLHPDDRAATEKAWSCALAEGRDYQCEHRFRRFDGEYRWFACRGAPIRDDAGNIVRWSGVSIDVTERKLAELRLQKAQRLLDMTMRLSQASLWEYALTDGDVSHSILQNHPFTEGLGYGREPPTVGNATFSTVLEGIGVPPEQRERVTRALQDCVDGKTPDFEIEHDVRGDSGETRSRLARGTVERDGEGKALSITGIAIDVTALKRAAEETRFLKERLELSVAGSKACTWDFELPDGRIVNSRATFTNMWQLLGYEDVAPPPFEQSLATLIPTDYQKQFVDDVQSFLDGSERAWAGEIRVRHRDGSDRWHLARGVAMRDPASGRATRFTGSSVDITDLKVAEQMLRESEEQFRATFENAAVGMAVSVAGGIFVACNQKVCDILGYSKGEIIGHRFDEFGIPDERPEDLERHRAFVRGDVASFSRDKQYIRKDGSRLWANVSVSVLRRDATGKPTHILAIVQDISIRKSLETDLQTTKERLELGIRGSGVSIFDVEMPDGSRETAKVTAINLWERLGYDESEIPRDLETVTELGLIPEEVEPVTRAVNAYLAGAIPRYAVEHRLRHRDGSTKWVLARGTALRDERGVARRFIGSHIDITERKVVEEKLRQANERLEAAIRSSNLSIWEYDMPDGVFENATETLTNVWESLGYDPTDAPPAMLAVIHPEDLARVVENIRAYMTGQTTTFETEHRVRRKDGTHRWVLGRGVAIRDAADKVIRFVGASVDITEIKNIEAALERAREAAETANLAKDEFLANVSHEIRTPMNAILGMTELALDSTLTDHQRQLLSTVKSAAKNLLGIINDLLDFSKIAAGKLALDESDFSLRAEVGGTMRALATRAHRKGLELICHIHPDVPDTLFGDAGRVRQVLMNLVGNALKFTARGEVVVEVRLAADAQPQTADTVSLAFAIRDTGIGIAREKQAAIFRAFEQEDPSTTRRYGGTGLGLTISAQLAALLDGAITVDSEPGRGSTFTFTARFARSPRSEARGAGSPELLEGLKVLAVDDSETSRRFLAEWLANWRMRPTVVGDARAAFEALDRGEGTGAPYSLVLLDGRMSDVDGITLAEQIKGRYGSSKRLILLSSDDSPVLATRSREVGIGAYVAKPALQADLLETICEVMNATAVDRRGPTPSGRDALAAAPIGPPLRVLVAEDNELNATLLHTLLGKRGHRADFAEDGGVALQRATATTYDLMLLDLHMPEMDGFEVIRAIRQGERSTGKHLPVIALTARSSLRDRDRCLAAGMDDFLAKPIEAEALWSAIDRTLAAFPPATPRQSRLLDPRAILQGCASDPTILEGMRIMFRRAVPDQLERVRAALADGAVRRLAEAAHKLSGTLGAFSTIAGTVALTLEDTARSEDFDSCVELVGRLDSMCPQILEETRGLTLDDLSALLRRS